MVGDDVGFGEVAECPLTGNATVDYSSTAHIPSIVNRRL